jgi:hypothetical protein
MIFISRSLRTLSSIGGWVLKRLTMDFADSGLTMNIWAVAGLVSMGTAFDAADNFSRALASP